MTDFLITEMTFYPWFTWLIVFLALAGVAYVAVWVHGLAGLASDWVAYRRAVLGWKTAVRRVGDDGDRLCPMHALEAERATGTDHLLEDDPPEYEHDDGPDPGYDWDGPGEDWSPGLAWGPRLGEPAGEMAGLATVIERAHAMGLIGADQLDPPLGEHDFSGDRCNNRDCDLHGFIHPPPCKLAPTMPAACYTEGAAMPPQPVREWLHPAIMDSLEAAGFSEHETNDGAVDSMWTRAMAREVEAMVTDGIIPTGEAGKEQ